MKNKHLAIISSDIKAGGISKMIGIHALALVREGYKLSISAEPSLKNSGEKITLLKLYFLLIFFVKLKETVDLITIVQFAFEFTISDMHSSTEEVSK